MTTILMVPGLGGSGPLHWQSRWEKVSWPAPQTRVLRVEQEDWDAPVASVWVARLEQAVIEAPTDVVLVAHSLGVVLVAHWVRAAQSQHSRSLAKIRGALLVAPPDVESHERVPAVIQHFAPIPREPLPFASIVVASRNDEYACIDCPRQLANAWGSRFVDVGERGHINADSNLGDWDEGQRLLAAML